MKGLLYKEYAVLKSQMKSWLVLLAFFVVYTGIFVRPYFYDDFHHGTDELL